MTTRLERRGQLAFLDFEAPVFVGFPALKRELVATLTFLDLVEAEGLVDTWILDWGLVFGSEGLAVTSHSPAAKYDEGAHYDEWAEWG